MEPLQNGMTSGLPRTAEGFNRGCACRSLDASRLNRELERQHLPRELTASLTSTHPHLFSSYAVFISPEQQARMAAVIRAVEQVVAMPAYQAGVLARAPACASLDFGPHGVFMGFDFHLASSGPQLIEINTNPGGALLNAALLRAQQACCREMLEDAFMPSTDASSLDARLIEMFLSEWRSRRATAAAGGALPERIAIIDDQPESQYLYPEFLLFRHLFASVGIDAVIADANGLQWSGGRLLYNGLAVDMVYNRLTDFHLSDPAHAPLRSAWEAGAVVLTPHPRAHALYADKRNLALLGDAAMLAQLQVPENIRAALTAGVPRTEEVSRENAEDLWARRRKLFFKPATGYGSKAAYRGDKLTRRVWEEILSASYVAQEFTPPSERLVEVDGAMADLKLDVRAYAYRGEILLLAARLYQGQTTNFRTAGGGFAPVFLVNPRSTTSSQSGDCSCPQTPCTS